MNHMCAVQGSKLPRFVFPEDLFQLRQCRPHVCWGQKGKHDVFFEEGTDDPDYWNWVFSNLSHVWAERPWSGAPSKIFFAGFKIGGSSRSLFAWGINKTVDGDMKTTKLAFVHGLVPHGPVLVFV